MKKYLCIRSYSGQHRAGMGDILDEIPPGVSPTFFEETGMEPESAMLPAARPRRMGIGRKPVTAIRGIGKKAAAKLAKAGIRTVAELAAADEEAAPPRLIQAAQEALR